MVFITTIESQAEHLLGIICPLASLIPAAVGKIAHPLLTPKEPLVISWVTGHRQIARRISCYKKQLMGVGCALVSHNDQLDKTWNHFRPSIEELSRPSWPVDMLWGLGWDGGVNLIVN